MRRIILLLVLLMLGYTHALKAQITDVYAGNDTIELRLNNYQYGFIQWQTSQDTIHWKDIEDATDTVYRFLPTENAYYRALAFFDNCPDVTSRVCYVQVPPKADAGSDRKLMQGSGGDHDYVDLGLPSGTLWATCNIGANTPEEYGDYFAWGETQPKDVYNWSTYQYCMGDYNTLTKYCTDSNFGYNGFADNLTVLLPEDDAATANWGNDWRMPTKEEWWELYQNTTSIWTTRNGVDGRLFTAPNGNSLFLPAAGCRWDVLLNFVGWGDDHWSSSLDTNYPREAWEFGFISDGCYRVGYGRDSGHSVRAVRSSSLSGQLPQITTSEVTSITSSTATCGGDHEYVDLGLPSGTLWATCNIGANTPEEYGDYFAWGETQPKDVYNWNTYQYCMGDYNTLTKYCTDPDYGYNGFADNLTVLLPEDDAATANWGNDWRMPTKEEWQELYQNTTSIWTTQNGVDGRLFTAPNGNSLFLPAAGYRWDDGFSRVGSYGYYWSGSRYTVGMLYFRFSSDGCYVDVGLCLSSGRSVRAVRSARQK